MTTTTVKTSGTVIQELQNEIANDTIFAGLLFASLLAAQNAASNNLAPDLYQALEGLYIDPTSQKNIGWPVTTSDYITYLNQFAEVIPSETDAPYSPWNNTPTQNGYSQEIYDRLCQFYFLIDQPVNHGDKPITLQNYATANFSFANWLVEYANYWGSFLDTEASLTQATLDSFINDPEYNIPDYADDSSNWKTFNTFFYRQLNSTQPDGTPMRPVANPFDNTIVTSPADCTFIESYQIDAQGNVVDNDGNPKIITLKQTHDIGNIGDLLGDGGSAYASKFYNGTFVHYFLSPFDYHRFHAPVGGTVVDIAAVAGNVYLAVNITNNQFDAPDSSEDGYEFTQARGVLVIDTSTSGSNVGLVAAIPIGMAQVSSVHMHTELMGQSVNKGKEFGYFAFGGSDIIMLFENPLSGLKFIETVANAEVPDSYTNVQPFHFRYGEPSVIICNPVTQS